MFNRAEKNCFKLSPWNLVQSYKHLQLYMDQIVNEFNSDYSAFYILIEPEQDLENSETMKGQTPLWNFIKKVYLATPDPHVMN